LDAAGRGGMNSNLSGVKKSASDQTVASFGDKWRENPKLLFDLDQAKRSGTLDWILNRNGFSSL
jgi:hypothetical protein